MFVGYVEDDDSSWSNNQLLLISSSQVRRLYFAAQRVRLRKRSSRPERTEADRRAFKFAACVCHKTHNRPWTEPKAQIVVTWTRAYLQYFRAVGYYLIWHINEVPSHSSPIFGYTSNFSPNKAPNRYCGYRQSPQKAIDHLITHTFLNGTFRHNFCDPDCLPLILQIPWALFLTSKTKWPCRAQI